MTRKPDPVTVLERVRQLETEITELLRGLGGGGESEPGGSMFSALEIEAAGSRLLIPIDQIREVVPVVWPEPIAGAPEWVMGSASYGSMPITLIDLGLRTHGRPTALEPDLVMVVVEAARWFGLVITSVGGVQQVDASSLTTPGPEIPSAPFLLGMARLDTGESTPVLSIRRIGRELDG